MNDFGANLKKLRNEKGFSQDAFAKKIDIHVTNLSKYERSISIPSLEIAKRIALVLDVSIDVLVFGNVDDADSINDKDLATLFRKTQLLTDKQKQTVKEFLSAFLFQNDVKKQLA